MSKDCTTLNEANNEIVRHGELYAKGYDHGKEDGREDALEAAAKVLDGQINIFKGWDHWLKRLVEQHAHMIRELKRPECTYDRAVRQVNVKRGKPLPLSNYQVEQGET